MGARERRAVGALMGAPTYLELSRVTGYRVTLIPRHKRRQDGYGTLVPGAYLLQIDGKRWHRVRTTCWSNAGTDFVRVGGRECILETGWHHSLAAAGFNP